MGELTLRSRDWENWHCSAPTAALEKVGSAPRLGSTVEPTLLAGMQVSGPWGAWERERCHHLFSRMSWDSKEKGTTSSSQPLPPVTAGRAELLALPLAKCSNPGRGPRTSAGHNSRAGHGGVSAGDLDPRRGLRAGERAHTDSLLSAILGELARAVLEGSARW